MERICSAAATAASAEVAAADCAYEIIEMEEDKMGGARVKNAARASLFLLIRKFAINNY